MKNIEKKIAAVVASGAISKDGKMKAAGTYNYHTIDGVVDHLRELFTQYGIGFSYTVTDHDLQITDNGTMITTKTIRAEFYCVDDPKDSVTVTEVGYGIDRQDKGPGKATSYALKTIFTALFMLKGQPDENDSADSVVSEKIGKSDADRLRKIVRESGIDEGKFLKAAMADSFENIPASRLRSLDDMLTRRKKGSA